MERKMFPLCPGFLKCDTVVLPSLRNAQVMEMPEMVENMIAIYNTTTKLGFELLWSLWNAPRDFQPVFSQLIDS